MQSRLLKDFVIITPLKYVIKILQLLYAHIGVSAGCYIKVGTTLYILNKTPCIVLHVFKGSLIRFKKYKTFFC